MGFSQQQTVVDSPRKASAAVIAIVMLLALGASTPAAVAGTVTYDGAEIVFTGGDELNHAVQFRYDPATGRDHVIDSQVIDSWTGAGCQYEPSYPDFTWVSCPGSNAVRVELGGGSDSVGFDQGNTLEGDCFSSYTINLGNGSNTNVMNPLCAGPATLAMTAGSGNDTLQGGPAGISAAIVAGGGDDTVNPSLFNGIGNGDDVIYGGEGADRVSGYGGNDQVYGEGGDDKVLGGAGNDVEDGGPGDDYIGFTAVNTTGEDDQGADQLRGGDGTDQLFLDGHNGGMAISLDGQANDGAPGEGDNVGSDIERFLGTTGNDGFMGSAGADYFDGFAGADEIHGAAGDDTLIGSDGDDSLFGDAGNDKVEGRYGVDRVDGGAGTDQLYGDIDGCVTLCEPDVDVLLARDGERDTVNCGGPGNATVDLLDVVAGGCAFVDRPNVVGGDAGAACLKAKGRLAKAKKKLRRLKANGAKAKAIGRQKKKVKKAKKAKKKACAPG